MNLFLAPIYLAACYILAAVSRGRDTRCASRRRLCSALLLLSDALVGALASRDEGAGRSRSVC